MPSDAAADSLAAIDAALLALERGDAGFAIFQTDTARNHFVQIVAGQPGSPDLHGEVIGNGYLQPADRLPDATLDRVVALGWSRPSKPGEMLSRDWPDWTGVHRRIVANDLWQAIMTAFGSDAASRLDITLDS